MDQFSIKPATRQAVKPLIGLYSESGCGKTFSSLLLARGLVGPSGKIVMADTESGRGSLYADVLAGGYDVLDVGAPFSASRAIGVMETIEASGAGVGIIDSASHFWEGIGGVLDMAGENEDRSGKPGLHNWRTPKMEHAKFVLKLLQSPLPWIICLRAKYKTRQVKNERGKTEIVKDETTTPIQAEDFIFEMTAHAEILHDHSIRLTKCSHPSLRDCFPKEGPITVKHGELLARWCAAPMQSQLKPDAERNALAVQLWRLLTPIHQGHADAKPHVLQHLIDEAFIMPDERLETLSVERLRVVIDKVTARTATVAQLV